MRLLALLLALPDTAPLAGLQRRLQSGGDPAHIFLPLPLAPQLIYLGGVPHTTKTGVRRVGYKKGTSFLPRALYHAITDTFGGFGGGVNLVVHRYRVYRRSRQPILHYNRRAPLLRV